MDYALNCSQPDASTFVCVRLVQTLKYSKQFIHVFHIKAHPVVLNEYYQVIGFPVDTADLDFGLRARAREFNRVRDKVNQYQSKHRTVSIEIGHCADFPGDVASLCVVPNFGESFSYELRQAKQSLLRFSSPDSRKSQEIVNQISHALGRVQDHPDVVVALSIDRGRSLLMKQLCKTGNMAKGCAEVMRDGIRKRL